MKAVLLFDERQEFVPGIFAEMVLWRVPTPVRGSKHSYKYRLALVALGSCVLRYDNEDGKGDHKHIGDMEQSYRFIDRMTLFTDFLP